MDFTSQRSGFSQIAQSLGREDVASAIDSLSQEDASKLTSLFVSGVKNENFSGLLEYLQQIAPSLTAVITSLLASANIQKIKHDNQQLLANIEKDLQSAKNRLQQAEMVHQQEASAQRAQIQLISITASNNMLKLMGEIHSILPSQNTDANSMFLDREVRDFLITDETMKQKAIDGGFLKVESDGSCIWLQ